MKELDLHGYVYPFVEDEVENFVLLYSKELPLRIITGKSENMRQIVHKVLDKHDFHYESPPHNFGEIIVLY
jgi:hypothetical protein